MLKIPNSQHMLKTRRSSPKLKPILAWPFSTVDLAHHVEVSAPSCESPISSGDSALCDLSVTENPNSPKQKGKKLTLLAVQAIRALSVESGPKPVSIPRALRASCALLAERMGGPSGTCVRGISHSTVGVSPLVGTSTAG